MYYTPLRLQSASSLGHESVTTMWSTFTGASPNFNSDVAWDTSHVESMRATSAEAFNLQLDWDTSKVTDMYRVPERGL